MGVRGECGFSRWRVGVESGQLVPASPRSEALALHSSRPSLTWRWQGQGAASATRPLGQAFRPETRIKGALEAEALPLKFWTFPKQPHFLSVG